LARYFFPPVWISAYMASLRDRAFGIADFTQARPAVKPLRTPSRKRM